MTLDAPAGSPWWLHAAAATLLYLHIGGASLGLVSGTAAVLARKGERLHRAAGTVFFVSMLTMSGIAAGVAPFLPDEPWTNTTAGAFTFYLVATAWATVRRKEGEVGLFEVVAFLAAAGLAAMGAVLFWRYANTPEASGYATVYVFAAVAALAAACDLRMIRRGGVSGPARIARHLWRMCAALFIASGSFFLGQQDVIPTALHGPHLVVLALAPLAALAFWLVRVRFTTAFKPVPAAA